MRKKAIAALLMSGLVAGAVAFAPATATAGKKPVTLATDANNDWGTNVDPTIQPIGDALGMELTGAQMSYDGKNVNFVIQLNNLPPSGGTPEIVRYVWDFNVDGRLYELDGKFTNYSRGTCDPTSGQCPPPRDPGPQPFLLRTNCATDSSTPVSLTLCEEAALVQAEFDPAAKSITIAVPAAALKAKKGTKITPAVGTFGGTITAITSAFVSNTAMPFDNVTVSKAFVLK